MRQIKNGGPGSVLVTGGAGYIGSHMVLELLDRGERPIVIDNLSTGFRWAVPEGVTFIEGDIGDRSLIDDVLREHKIREIIHFAAKIVVPESVVDPLGYYLANTVKTRELLEAAVRAGVRQIVFSSTAAVYGNPPITPVSEEVPPAPLSPYGTSKLMSEWMLRDAAAAHGFSYVALRYFNVAGADPKGRSGQSTPQATHLIKVAVQAALGLRPNLTVFGTDYKTRDGTCVRDYIHVSDLVAAHTDALTYLRQGGESLIANCGYGRGYSVLNVIEAVRRVSGVEFPVVYGPRRSGDPASIVAAVDLARERLHWAPRHDNLGEIVAQALQWERSLVERGMVAGARLQGMEAGA